MVLGNHDLFNKNSTDVNSINIFRDNDNVEVIDQATEVDINGKKSLLVPWLADLTSYSRNQFHFMFGHFDISSKFLIASYTQEHSRKISASSNVASELSEDMLLDEPSNATSNLDEYLGSFIELVEESGTIFAGHIHQHKEMVARRRKFIFVGSPYEQTLGDIGCKCGFYLLNEDGSYKFIENASLPKHVQVFASAVKNRGIDKYDFSLVKGNIVQKVYDIDIPMEDDLKINQKIASFKPYEELLPDYQVALDFTKEESGTSQDNLMKMLKKSKLDYIESYVSQLDEGALAQSGVAKEPLLAVLKKYYASAVGE